MENEIKRGDYVELAGSLSEFHPNIIDKLYDQHRGRIGLVRAVKYVPGHANGVAEVIFSGVPYISEVPVIHQHIYHDYIVRDMAATPALTDLLQHNQNSLKGESTMKITSKKPAPSNPIKQVIFNGPATIVYWNDGCKTVMKCQDVDTLDPEKGLAMAIAKHYLCDICGLARYDGIFKKYLPKETKEK